MDMWHASKSVGRSSIRFRIFRLIVVVTSVALVISMAGGILFDWINQQQQIKQSMETLARATGVAASAAVAFKDTVAAREALRILAAQSEVEAAALYPLGSNRLADYGDVTRLPLDVDQLRDHPPEFGLLSPRITILQPISVDDSTIGHIVLSARLKSYRDIFLLQVGLAIVVNLLGLLIVLLLGLRFLDDIVDPVKELARTSRQVREEQNFSLRAKSLAANAPRDEIDELTANFNAMLAEIEQREHELSEYHKGLEQMVLERTEALSAANRELQQAKAAAETSTVVKSRFLAAASHDLRQPVFAINLFKDALNNTALTDEQKRIATLLSRSTQGLGDLLDALLDVSKLDAGAITPARKIVGIHELFGSIEAEFAAMASAKSLRFKLQFPFSDMALLTDGKLLQSLLRNLIGNALKYTEAGGVLVAIRRRKDQALFQVWDTGIGIAPEDQQVIFDEYFQVANPERDKAKGLGLGLAIAKRLAKLLDTEIVCRSRLGQGSVFQFRLPLASMPLPAFPPSPLPDADASAESTVLAGKQIVVIEDDAMVAQAIQIALESMGMRTRAYATAEQALSDAAITTADFYISDLRLGDGNGLDVLEAIQQRATGPIRAIILTGETSPGGMSLLQATRWPVLFKPVNLMMLVSAIEQQYRLH
jgi:signal transduction histidine kinase